MPQKYIEIKGARVNNLKNVSVKIPRNKLVAIAGVSGSGKSSLAFDTLYAEGQRRYVESLSAYARQFLGRMKKPECDYILGLPPAIAIEQKVIARNPRSTVGTSTEIYEFMRLLYARIGKTYSPISGVEVKKHTPEDLVECMKQYPEGTKFLLIAGNGGDNIIDRLKVHDRHATEIRLLDSAETAFADGNGRCMLRFINDDGTTTDHHFSTIMEADGMRFEEPTEHLFAFNSPAGVCPKCEGFGNIIGIDENLVIPDPTLSVYDGCVACWHGDKLGEWLRYFIRRAAIDNFPIFTPYNELSDEHRGWLWHGLPCDANVDRYERVSIDDFFRMVQENQYKIQYRVLLSRYRGKTVCPECQGNRLRKEASYVRVGGKTITELVSMPIDELTPWFHNLASQLSPADQQASKRLLTEITSRLQYLLDVGLGYITLNRPSNSLSGGESQRINLTTSIGSPLVGSLYILDEPSIGLHSRDTQRLINILRKLRDIGNTVVVVEHDEDILRAADHLIEVGPDAGRNGGEIVTHGGYTEKYLSGEETIPVPTSRRSWNDSLTFTHCHLNNLKDITVDIPLNVMTVITGVSGSGKSSLVRGIIYPNMVKKVQSSKCKVHHVEMVDQNPIGKSTRSNAATYLKAYDAIRQLYASQQLARQMNITPAHFSFNTDGGRCEECKGAGVVTVEMQFMADLTLTCEACHGKRFKPQVLEVQYRGKNIDDVLNMTVDEALEFFGEEAKDNKRSDAARICAALQPLSDVGLGYIQLGQSSSTLSGGENQRVKLAYYIAQERQEPTLFIFDEPTTGLHFHDINLLLRAFDRLISRGHTILIVEHNMDVIKCADHIIDLGPEGGEAGGTIVTTGTPEQVAASGKGYTSIYLKEKLGA